MGLTREGAGVLSTVSRHLSFLDSELVAAALAQSTFDPAELRTCR
jgi:type IV secretory pathway TraG/TraD family ATPase VirD4